MEVRDIVNIKVENLYPHPENPRKDLGDVSELAESIKKNGIMQNLTVIPGHKTTHEEWEEYSKAYRENPTDEMRCKMNSIHTGEMNPEGYTVIIGHRRCEAAKLAGLTELPCRIVENMSEKEQLATMLEENMQRSDLTVYEQAQGFQMMLDLGETEDSIAEKTGFSKRTIRRRLNIAKLDQSVLKEKEDDKSFQLSITDLYELEKVESIETRDKILKEAKDSRDLAWRIQSAVKAEEKAKKVKKIVPMLEELGIKEAPDEAKNDYTGKWQTVKEIDFSEELPEQIELDECEEPLFYCEYWKGIKVVKKAKKEKKEATPEDIERKKKEANKKELKELQAKMNATRKMFVENIISGKIDPIKDTEAIKDSIWDVLMDLKPSLYQSTFIKFVTGKTEYDCTQEEKAEARQKIESLSVLHQMLIAMHQGMDCIGDLVDWCGYYSEGVANRLKNGYAILEKYGWSFEEEDEKLLNGTHELYVVREAEEEVDEEDEEGF